MYKDIEIYNDDKDMLGSCFSVCIYFTEAKDEDSVTIVVVSETSDKAIHAAIDFFVDKYVARDTHYSIKYIVCRDLSIFLISTLGDFVVK